jgi:hypothetical protein
VAHRVIPLDAEFRRYRRIADMDHAEQIAAQAVEAADP